MIKGKSVSVKCKCVGRALTGKFLLGLRESVLLWKTQIIETPRKYNREMPSV